MPPGTAAAAVEDGNVTPAEIQRMFDSYALMQAQDQLKINDEQYPQFLTRFKALQDVRRRTLHERTRIDAGAAPADATSRSPTRS